MANSPEKFNTIVDGLEVSYSGIEIEDRLLLASEDPIVIESVKDYLERYDKAQYEADILINGPDICRKYSLHSDYSAEPWKVRQARLEAQSTADVDPIHRLDAQSYFQASQLIDTIVLPYVYDGQPASRQEVYIQAARICEGLPVKYDELIDIVNYLILKAQAGQGHAPAEY